MVCLNVNVKELSQRLKCSFSRIGGGMKPSCFRMGQMKAYATFICSIDLSPYDRFLTQTGYYVTKEGFSFRVQPKSVD